MCKSKEADADAQQKSDAGCDGGVSPCKDDKIKPSKCMVQFRPKAGWKGEFGFDWMRTGDTGETKYETLIKSAFGSTTPFSKLKSEYNTIPSKIAAETEYFVPWLNLYPKETAGTPTPPSEAELLIKIAVEEEAPDKIEIEFDNTLFSLDKTSLTDKAVGAKRNAADGILKIKCLKEFDSDKEINVYAYPPNWKSKSDATLAGRIIVCKNNTSNRKAIKFVMINVKTKINGIERAGSISTAEKTHLSNSLYQALITGAFEDGPVLDLTKDPNFMIKTDKAGVKTYGKFIYKKTSAADINNDGALYEDYPSSEMFTYMRTTFLNTAGNEKYKTGNYFTIFALNETTYDTGTLGQIQKTGIQNLLLFADTTGSRVLGVISHEALHGLGLQHTHEALGADNPYNFTLRKTENIMSYNTTLIYTWHWQWSNMKKNM